MSLLTDKAYSIAARAHKGQKDRAGQPYIKHPIYVASCVDGEMEKVVAYLHDVVEDTDITIEHLRNEGIPEEALISIEALTHSEEEDYFEYIRRLSMNPLAATVKRADLKHNSDLSRIANPSEKDKKRLHKYKRALQILEGMNNEQI